MAVYHSSLCSLQGYLPVLLVITAWIHTLAKISDQAVSSPWKSQSSPPGAPHHPGSIPPLAPSFAPTHNSHSKSLFRSFAGLWNLQLSASRGIPARPSLLSITSLESFCLNLHASPGKLFPPGSDPFPEARFCSYSPQFGASSPPPRTPVPFRLPRFPYIALVHSS